MSQIPARSLRKTISAPDGMSPSQPEKASAPQRPSMHACKHPRVQIVSRDEDSEFVECLECGEIFESSEFKDMAIEESTPLEEA